MYSFTIGSVIIYFLIALILIITKKRYLSSNSNTFSITSKNKKTHKKWGLLHLVTRTGFEPVNACVKGM